MSETPSMTPEEITIEPTLGRLPQRYDAAGVPERPCLAVGELLVDGRRKAWLRCALPAGHERGREHPAAPRFGLPEHVERGTPHAVTFEWEDDEALRVDWPEGYDPAEPFDVDVPLLSDDELAAIAQSERVDAAVDAEREARAWPDEA